MLRDGDLLEAEDGTLIRVESAPENILWVTGETPHAFVVLHEDASTTEDEVIAFAREHLAHFKAPSGVTFVGELPKTATGKIQKYVLRKGAPNLSAQ